MKAEQILETCLYAEDLKAAEDFYDRVLGLQFFARVPGRHVFFRCGPSMILLFNPSATEVPHPEVEVPCHGSRGPGHACFVMSEGEIDSWRNHLEAEGVEIEKEMTWPGGGTSLYFRDPAGNSLELATRSLWSEAPASPSNSPTRRS